MLEAIQIASDCGLNIRISGIGSTSPGANDIVCEQSIPPNTVAKRGQVIIIRALVGDFED